MSFRRSGLAVDAAVGKYIKKNIARLSIMELDRMNSYNHDYTLTNDAALQE